MRKYVSFFLFVAAVCSALASSGHAENCPDLSLVTVTGDAEVKVIPDEVVLTLGVETWNQDLTVAKRKNDNRVQKVFEVAQKLKIEEKDIQTDHISIEPRYKDQWEHREFIGFFVRKTVALTLKDTSKFEELLSSVLTAGANYVHGIEFRTTELRKYRDQARAMAIKAAQEKATALTRELGKTVGRPHMIQEGRVGWWSGYNSWWGSRCGGQMMQQNVVQNVGSPSEGESSVALGQISVTANVTVSFELQ